MSSEADPPLIPAQSQSDKVRRACDECWKKKIKCDMKKPTCSQCDEAGRSCKYERPLQRPGVKKGYMPLLETRVRLLENELNVLKFRHSPNDPPGFVDQLLIKHFFYYVNRYLGVFHEQSFMSRLSTQPMSLLYIMYALGLLYYQADTECSFDFTLLDRYFTLSHSELTLDKTASIDTCLTLFLISHYAFLRGKESIFLLSQSLVVRQAYMLQLHMQLDHQLPLMQKEIRSRLWWAIYGLERKLRIYYHNIPSQIPPHAFPIALPCSDSYFNAFSYNLQVESERSIRGHMTVLMSIYGRIVDAKNRSFPYNTRILEAALMDWYNVVREIIIEIDLDDEQLPSYDDDYWLRLHTKAMYHSAYIFLYNRELREISLVPSLSEMQLGIFHTCMSSASSLSRMAQLLYKRNAKCLYMCPFTDFCWFFAGMVYLRLKKSPFHSNFYSESSYDAVLNLLMVRSKFSNFASRLHSLLLDDIIDF